ncbi:MAG: DUF1844 domain-containing protein [Candidatus Omnitrophica bacterium]|jgi:coproporphyrinogen III oxidase-like Fe-S oxidoreductase|nr:DUF1844 domain-containing protein [Candidatus Omnitrophota bacterium]
MDEINKPEGNGSASDSRSQKKVDESWKEKVEKEKQAPKEEGKFTPPEPDFKFFITTLALQVSIALGHMANPETQKTQKDPAQAKFIIDTLGMLQEKTKGNLTPEETQLLENLLYELRVAYLALEKGESAP